MPFFPKLQIAIPAYIFAIAVRNWAYTVLPIAISQNFIVSTNGLIGRVLLEVRLESALDEDTRLNSLLTGRGFLTSVKLDALDQAKLFPAPKQLFKIRSLFLMPEASAGAFDGLIEVMSVLFDGHPFVKTIGTWNHPVYIELKGFAVKVDSTLFIGEPIFAIEGLDLLYPAPIVKNLD